MMAAPRFDTPFYIEHGDVWRSTVTRGRKANPRHVCDGTGELAIVHDGKILLHAGSAQSAEAWLEANKPKFELMNVQLEDLGEGPVELIVVRMPVHPETVNEMNACLAVSGRVSRIHDRLETFALSAPAPRP